MEILEVTTPLRSPTAWELQDRWLHAPPPALFSPMAGDPPFPQAPASPIIIATPSDTSPSAISCPDADTADMLSSHNRGFPTVHQRLDFYESIPHAMLDHLNHLDAFTPYLASHPPIPGSFFPMHPDLCGHSLYVAAGLFSVRPSTAVPGEMGLFLDDPLPSDSIITPMGCYTGWIHAFEDGDQGCPNFTSPVFDMYCLDIGNGLIVTAYDASLSHAQRVFLFP